MLFIAGKLDDGTRVHWVTTHRESRRDAKRLTAMGWTVLGVTDDPVGMLDDSDRICSARAHGATRRGLGRYVCATCQQEAIVGGLLMSIKVPA
jgi:hypothetical protein